MEHTGRTESAGMPTAGRITRRDLLRGAGSAGLGLLGAAALAACGPGGPGGKTATVTWLVRTGLIENKWEQQTALPDFKKASPNINVNLVIAPGGNPFDQKLFTLFAAGQPIDIWSHWGNAGFGEFAARGMLGDLTGYVQADHYDLNAFLPGLVPLYQRDGKLLGLPNDTTFGMPLFYDVPLLQKAGVQPPPTNWDQPWSWQQWIDAGHKMTKDYGSQSGTYGVEMSTDLQLVARLGGNNLFADDAAKTGVAKPGDYHANTPETLHGVQAVYDLMFKEKVMPTQELGNAITSSGLDPFRAQKVATNMDGGWDYWSYKPQIHNFTWAVGADPKLVTNTTTAYTDPWMLAIHSREPEAAWAFMKYLLSDAGQTAYSTATGAPPCRATVVTKWWQEFTGPTGLSVDQLKEVTLGALQHSFESYNHLLTGYGQIITAETQSMNLVWTGVMTPEQGVALAEQRVNQVLATL
jgi:multiple sugar transport system substrate-binding protein